MDKKNPETDICIGIGMYRVRDLNPCYRRERAAS